MRIKVDNKRILACLLLCSLFLTIFIYVNPIAMFSVGGGSAHSSMQGGSTVGLADYLAVSRSSEYAIFSIGQSQRLGTKNGFSILTAIVAALVICLFYYARISAGIYAKSNSTNITVFLHKKDGKK